MYGAQTNLDWRRWRISFENDVEMYGAQTLKRKNMFLLQFENDVEMYGAQTLPFSYIAFQHV